MLKTTHTWTIYIDGASRNNPGPSGAGIFMKKDGEVVGREGFYLGKKTNNQAEYYALVLALYFLNEYAHTQDMIHIVSDSELLVKQIKGLYKVKNEGLLPLFNIARSLMKFSNLSMKHVLRADNKDADKLANLGVDSKKPLPEAFIRMLTDHGIHV